MGPACSTLATRDPIGTTASCAPALDRLTTVGVARLMRIAYQGDDLTPTWVELSARAERDPTDAAALMDLATILYLVGAAERGRTMQSLALNASRLYRRPHGRADGLRVLALMVPGDLMANTPLDFLLQGSDVELTILYVGFGRDLPAILPEHDICVMAISESRENQAILGAMGALLASWPRPVVNAAAERIATFSRDAVADLLRCEPKLAVADNIKCGRDELTAVAARSTMPIIVRPVDTHAGHGMQKIDHAEALHDYLARQPEAEFYLGPFIDYRSTDGLFRKQRVAFIGGRAYASHMAVSEHWMVHYLSAGMDDDAGKRAEEAHFFATFDTDFAVRHAAGLAAIQRRVGLDYFQIDCAELPCGRLLVFEVDVAMIVHDLDPVDRYPYKKPAMATLFAAFQAMLERRSHTT